MLSTLSASTVTFISAPKHNGIANQIMVDPGPLVQSGAGLAIAAVLTIVLARVADELFSPSLQRPLGPKRAR